MSKKLNKKQLSALTQFQEFTACGNRKVAVDILQDVNWKVDQAVEVFFTNYAGQVPMEEEDQKQQEPVPEPVAPSMISVDAVKGNFFIF